MTTTTARSARSPGRLRSILLTFLALSLIATTAVAGSALGQDRAGPPFDPPGPPFEPPGPPGKATIAALDPRGIRPVIELTPLTPRPDDMTQSTVYLISTSGFSAQVYSALGAELQDRYPGVDVVTISGSTSPSQAFLNMVAQQADAFVYGSSMGSTPSASAADAAIALETRGVAGAHLVHENLQQIADWRARVSGVPLRIVPAGPLDAAELARVVEDLVDALTVELTEEEQRTGVLDPGPPGQVAIEGTAAEVQAHFREQRWTEGQAIVPPTAELVDEMLAGTSHPRDLVVAETFGCEGWGVTVETVAINAVMVGALPEYMPVLLATVDGANRVRTRSAIGSGFDIQTSSTNGFGFMQVVNGPIAQEIGMNSAAGALGPGYHANATIGRALQLFIRNLGGCESGVSMNPTMGNNTLYGGVAFAENEAASPWEPLHVSLGGYDPDDSVLTFMTLWNSQVGNYFGTGLSRAVELARTMAHFEYPSGLVALISPDAAWHLADQQGMSKDDFADFLYENATHQLGDLRQNRGFWNLVQPQHPGYAALPNSEIVSVYPRQFIRPIVVGGQGQVPHLHGWNAVADVQVSIDTWR